MNKKRKPVSVKKNMVYGEGPLSRIPLEDPYIEPGQDYIRYITPKDKYKIIHTVSVYYFRHWMKGMATATPDCNHCQAITAAQRKIAQNHRLK